MPEHFKFFANRECEYFPCHDVEDADDFNCLFCYCPLYALGEKCGGGYEILENGVKDCSHCPIPHEKGAYDYIIERFDDIIELTKKK